MEHRPNVAEDSRSGSRLRTVLPQIPSSPEAMSSNSGKDRQSSSVVIVLNYHSPNRWVFSKSSDENQSKACSEAGFPTDDD